MKQLVSFALICMVSFTLAGSAFSQSIAGTEHDFSGKSWNTTGEICVVCHAPHNSTGGELLWNHEASTATYTIYTSSSLDATLGQPDGSSKLCLSCHDGTVAVDNFGGATGGTDFVTGSHLIGTDLMNDHPVSFLFDAALASLDGGLYDPTTQSSGLGGTIASDMLDNNGKLQCASCHNPHDDTVNDFLVKSNGMSALCLTCHKK